MESQHDFVELNEPGGAYSKGFENLESWKEARSYRKAISGIVKTFPPEEKFGLSSQLLRSSRSISATIAEGYGRFHYRETAQFFRHARGSLMESMDHLICAFDENYIDEDTIHRLRKQHDLILKLINGYIAYLIRQMSQHVNT